MNLSLKTALEENTVLFLNRWYRIAFPSRPKPVGIFVTVTDEDPADVDYDCFVVELESSADFLVEKVRMTSLSGETLALCSNAMGCIQHQVQPIGIEADLYSQLVWSPEICPQTEWMVYDPASDTTRFALFFSLLLDPDSVQPCNDAQPEMAIANDDPALGTVGAYPMVFSSPGGGGGNGKPGKMIRIIWKPDVL